MEFDSGKLRLALELKAEEERIKRRAFMEFVMLTTVMTLIASSLLWVVFGG